MQLVDIIMCDLSLLPSGPPHLICANQTFNNRYSKISTSICESCRGIFGEAKAVSQLQGPDHGYGTSGNEWHTSALEVLV